ncbi:type II toxin-antitoxin system VapB family antitoxin [Nocardioides sp. T2.26MG-1]|uniref:type II toxin-antitoxin system VapB family antitoxin n=1 Tax=Nocardioides sp. T2.26MG-1 TaxID=3041166 RepID=UPI00247792B3|nr:type II toxin-antitoxin system VapB family antitoxin [Nocardioides sp. T2.26MG-1]CAI9409519.1 Antitoxin VapB11 [Nocardioides sp. T2.26MG-1]
MARTNIDIDEALVTEVMRRFRLKTKREAVDFALRRAAGSTATSEGLLSLEGLGWDGDLDELRSDGSASW